MALSHSINNTNMTNNSLQLFQFESNEIRVVLRDGEPWWIAKDVCQTLEIGNVSQSLTKLRQYEKDIILTDTLGGKQELAIISESGLYRLVMRSRKEAAERFQDWVCQDVLPSIRKTGSYSVVPQTYLEALKALVAAEEEKARLVAEVEAQKQELAIADAVIEEQAETIDEIYGWSSIVRVSIENNVKETIYQWRKLKAATLHLGLEPKRVPCPRFGEKLLYPAEAWAIAYPDAKMPQPKQTTALTTYNNH